MDTVLVGIENHDDFTQANIDSGRVAYSIGIIYGMLPSLQALFQFGTGGCMKSQCR